MKLNNTKKLKKFKESSFLEFFEKQTLDRLVLDDGYTCDEIYNSYELWCREHSKCVDSFEQVELILEKMGKNKKIECLGRIYYSSFTLRDMRHLINLAKREKIIDNKGESEEEVLIYIGEKYKTNNDVLDILLKYCDKKNYNVVDILTVDDIRNEVSMQYELKNDRFLMNTLIGTIENFGPTRIITLNSKMVSIDYDLLEKLLNTLKNNNCKLEFAEVNEHKEKVALNLKINDNQLRDGCTLQTQILGLYDYCLKHDYQVAIVALNVEDYDDWEQSINLLSSVDGYEITKVISLDTNIVSYKIVDTLSTVIEIMEYKKGLIGEKNIIRKNVDVVDNYSYLGFRFAKSKETVHDGDL